MAADNVSLGQFNLEGIPPARRGLPQIEVTFDIDANGILHVSAQDKATGKQQSVAITASTNLDKGEVERMVREAEINKAADERRKKLIEARNEGDALAYSVERSLEDLGDKVSAGDRQADRAVDRGAAHGRQGRGRQRDPLGHGAVAAGQLPHERAGLRPARRQRPTEANGAGYTNGHSQPGGSATGDEDVVEGEFRTV